VSLKKKLLPISTFQLLLALYRPVKMVPDPFRGAPHIIVLCECVLPDGSPAAKNTRRDAAEIFAKDEAAEPWYVTLTFALVCEPGATWQSVGVVTTAAKLSTDQHPLGLSCTGSAWNRSTHCSARME